MLQRFRGFLLSALARRFFYGWVILSVAMLIMFGTGAGQSHLIGFFFEPVSAELGLSRTSIALAYGGATFFAALLLPKLGRIIDRHGASGTVFVIALALGLTSILFSFADSWPYIAIGFGVLRFLGQGALTLCCVNLISQWFSKRRGLAFGLMSLGFPLSVAIHPPLCQWLIDTVGWRHTWVWIGFSTWGLLLVPIVLFLYSKPEALGLLPDGELRDARMDGTEVENGFTLSEALRTPAFYIIAASLFSLSMLVTALHLENKGILTSHGLSAQSAALMFTITGVTAAICMPIVGHLLDRCRAEWMLAGGLLVMVASLLSATLINDLTTAIIYAIIFGVNNGVTMTYFAFFWPKYFGRKNLGSIQGTGQMIGITGASVGPLPLAAAVDISGSYDGALTTLVILPLGCALLALVFLRTPVHHTRLN